MIKNSIFRYWSCLLYTCLLCTAYSCDSEFKKDKYIVAPKTELGGAVAASGIVAYLKHDEYSVPADGVEQLSMDFINTKGFVTKLFLFKVDMNSRAVTIGTMTAEDDRPPRVQKLRDQAEVKNRKQWIWGAVNASPFNLKTGEPIGVIYKNGQCIKDYFDSEKDVVFAVMRNNSVFIYNQSEYNKSKGNIRDAVCGQVTLIKNSVPVKQSDVTTSARTVAGIADNNQVFFMVVDAGDYNYSNGMTYDEVIRIFQALGVKNAIALDGDGRSSFLVRSQSSIAGNLFRLLNVPSEAGGREIAVSTGLAIMKSN